MKTKQLYFAAAIAAVAVLAATVAPESYAAILHAAGGTAIVGGLAGFAFMGDIQLIRSKELRQQRANLVEENRKTLEKVQAEKDKARQKELEAEWDKRDGDIVELTRQIERAERQEALDAEELKPVQERRSGRTEPGAPSAEQVKEHQEAYRKAFWRYIAVGEAGLEAEEQQVLRRGRTQIRGIPVGGERRDGMTTTNAAGGYMIPAGFFNQLQEALLAFGGARDGATILTTDMGNALTIPLENDTTQKAQIIGEGSALTSPQDPVFDVATLNAFMYRSLIKVTLELLQDSAFDLEAYARRKLVDRVARGTNAHFTLGNGSTQPQGYMVGATAGVTSAAAATVTYTELVSLEHSVDPAYRRGPGVRWKFNDSTLKALKTLLDSQNRPLWQPGLAVKEPDTFMGYPYSINQDMSSLGASASSIAFGDFSAFFIRDVSQLMVVRANELFIGNGMIGFFVFSRHDSQLVDAGTHPIKYLTGQSA